MKSTDPNFIQAQKDGEKWMKEHPNVPVVDVDTCERKLAKDWTGPHDIAEKLSFQYFPNGTSIGWIPEARQRCFEAILKALSESETVTTGTGVMVSVERYNALIDAETAIAALSKWTPEALSIEMDKRFTDKYQRSNSEKKWEELPFQVRDMCNETSEITLNILRGK